MYRSHKLLILIVLMFLNMGLAASEIATVIKKSDDGVWRVVYSSKIPVKQIVFKRSPDNSRVNRWKPIAADFQILVENGSEIVSRIDGGPFTQAEFTLTSTYISLPKEYAPFSPFSDGGMLLHSGRFFACAESCDDSLNKWNIKVQATKKDNIIVGGVIHNGEASWEDSNSGIKVYIGEGEPIIDDNFVSLIDTGLPDQLKEMMSSYLPKILLYYSNKMGALNYRPSLFASYSHSDDGSYGQQGGILPGQIFMHWYGARAIKEIDENSTLWFFAHEVAHLYQGKAGKVEVLSDAWLHEGGAEFFAGITYQEILDDPKLFLDKLEKAQLNCLNILENENNYRKAVLTNTKIHYSCGLLLFDVLNDELKARKSNIFELWMAFNSAVENGGSVTSSTFIEVAKPFVSYELWLNLSQFIKNPEFNSKVFFQNLIDNKPKTKAGTVT